MKEPKLCHGIEAQLKARREKGHDRCTFSPLLQCFSTFWTSLKQLCICCTTWVSKRNPTDSSGVHEIQLWNSMSLLQGCVCMLLESWPTFNLPSTALTASSSLVLSLRNSGSTMDTGLCLSTCWLLLIMYLTRLFVYLSSFPFLAWNAHNAMVILNQRYFKWKRCKFDLLTFCPGFRNPPYIYVPSNKHKCRISPMCSCG